MYIFLSNNSLVLKDIVQPKKRGAEKGTIQTDLTSYTIADIF